MRNNYADPDATSVSAHVEASSAAAVITIAASEVEFWALDWITWSYADVPTNGTLTVEIGGTTVWEIDITDGGPGHIEFNRVPLYTNTRVNGQPKKNEAVVITLSNGGTVGKVNVRYR